MSATEAVVANEVSTGVRYEAYWEAIQRRVCGVCLDQADDGSCGLSRRTCALQAHLPRLAEVLARVQSTRMEEYEAAVRAEICAHCPEQDAACHCALREQAACALFAYLPLVLEAVEGVNERLAE
jgi:hypothetical protein